MRTMLVWYLVVLFVTEWSQIIQCRGPPTVSIVQGPYVPKYGTQFTIKCTVRADPNITEVFWKRNVNGLVTKLHFGLPGTKGMSTDEPSLSIKYATMIDSGLYTCFATNTIGTGQSNAVNVMIVNGDLPNVTVVKDSYTVVQGNNVTMDCDIVSYLPLLHVDWQFNKSGSLIVLNEKAVGTQGITLENPSLTLVSPSISDSGLYTCVGTNKVGTRRSKIVSLSVIGDIPTVTAGDNYSVLYGNAVTLRCIVNAVPNVTSVFWEKTRNGSKTVISHGTSGITGIQATDPSMTIVNATLSDTGEFKCLARNEVGLGIGDTTTLVVVGGIPVVKVGAPAYTIPYGQRITLACSVSAIPEQTLVYWQKNISGLITSVNYNALGTTGISPEIPSLTFNFATLSDSGVYSCFAANAVGTGQSQSSILRVTGEIPVISMVQSAYSVVYGKEVTLHCEIKSSPNFTMVYWHKEVNETISVITKDSTGIKGSTIHKPSLTILHSTASDSGLYTCFARNAIGTGRSIKPSNLSVISNVPFVSTGNNIYTSTEGHSLKIPCTVHSNPPHNYIFWKRIINETTTRLIPGMVEYDGMTVDNPSLLIKHVTMMMAGEYICSAINELGTGYSFPTKLIVQPKTDDLTNYSSTVSSASLYDGDITEEGRTTEITSNATSTNTGITFPEVTSNAYIKTPENDATEQSTDAINTTYNEGLQNKADLTNSEKKLGGGEVAGLVVGVIVFCALVVGLIMWVKKKRHLAAMKKDRATFCAPKVIERSSDVDRTGEEAMKKDRKTSNAAKVIERSSDVDRTEEEAMKKDRKTSNAAKVIERSSDVDRTEEEEKTSVGPEERRKREPYRFKLSDSGKLQPVEETLKC